MLKYLGRNQYTPGIPARDLTEDEIDYYAVFFEVSRDELINRLTRFKLYAYISPDIDDTQPIDDMELD